MVEALVINFQALKLGFLAETEVNRGKRQSLYLVTRVELEPPISGFQIIHGAAVPAVLSSRMLMTNDITS
jgi:hypothetical protein